MFFRPTVCYVSAFAYFLSYWKSVRVDSRYKVIVYCPRLQQNIASISIANTGTYRSSLRIWRATTLCTEELTFFLTRWGNVTVLAVASHSEV